MRRDIPKSIRHAVFFVTFLCSALVLFGNTKVKKKPKKPTFASIVYVKANVITVDPKQPKAQAIAIKGSRILAVGSEVQIRRHVGPKTTVMDMKGAVVIPGLIESHGHLLGLGLVRARLNLRGIKSVEAIAKMVKQRASQQPRGTWIIGRGWDQNIWKTKKFPTHHSITAAAPHHPVFLSRIDGHAAWVNRAAMKSAGLTSQTPTPQGGQIVKDKQKNPTGVLVDRAMEIVRKKIPPRRRKYLKKALQLGIQESLASGLTGFHDAGAPRSTISLYKELLQEDKLPLRMYVMLSGGDKKLLQEYFKKGPEIGLGQHHLTIRSIKLMADGALGSRGAALLEPYSDKHNHKGLLILPEKKIYAMAKQALKYGFQVATHAIGDKTNRATLNAYERAMKEVKTKASPRFRVEHAQIIHSADIPRFAKLGIIASMQPTHCTSDMPWAPTRLGKRTKISAYPWQSLLRSGAIIASGSDAPVESVKPLWGYYAAITRQDHKGKPAGGWLPEQRMTRMQALQSFTIHGAYAAFEETIKGSITPGKLADFTVLSHDITTIPPAKILQTKIIYTIIGGKIVYRGN